jgi:hypothetical protein
MRDPKPPSWDDIKDLIARVDEVCKEAERVSEKADRSMKTRVVWPDRRKGPRSLEE